VNQDTGKAALQVQTKKTARPWMLGTLTKILEVSVEFFK
jgi:hypothetical protein